MTGAEIPWSKVKALREALARDGTVTFKNGSIVRLEQTEVFKIGEAESPSSVIPHIEVERPAGGIARFSETEAAKAYAMALYGPAPKEQPSGDGERFGDVPF